MPLDKSGGYRPTLNTAVKGPADDSSTPCRCAAWGHLPLLILIGILVVMMLLHGPKARSSAACGFIYLDNYLSINYPQLLSGF